VKLREKLKGKLVNRNQTLVMNLVSPEMKEHGRNGKALCRSSILSHMGLGEPNPYFAYV
jgi:hypothetical protein